ncbi:hypothetical protein ACKUB1_04680 [Methanospirillum stamsii]|uniref:Uncharacterized protein n=1 Tax=Methanospirillum stamsii TaxID=1277351 RepID=A0A2V2NAN0_9EURY|nr:hypothetical protein [Methanospirillum stamsii]PWR73538.1 hypothetical protein DLD82_09890 [Methanospirillum stamsii]
MKKYISISIILATFIILIGIITADRLPSQVPENQIFTVDTLIDSTGPIYDESSLDWTLDDQNRAVHYAYVADGYNVNNLYSPSQTIASAINDLNSADYKWVKDNNGNLRLTYLNVDDYLYTKHIPGTSTSWGELLETLDEDYNDYIVDQKIDTGSIHNTKLNSTEEIMILTWTDFLRSNGGKISLNKNIDFDSQDKGKSLSNLKSEKILTYASTEGAHLIGSEEWVFDVAGNWERTGDSIRCVFTDTSGSIIPAFCNVVKAKSELVNMNSGQISSRGAVRGVAETGDVPGAMSYRIAVSPDSNSNSGFAEGAVKTLFGGSIMEAHGRNNIPSATNNWRDVASVTGGIKTFQKTFGDPAYTSGITGTGDPDDYDRLSRTSITPTPTPNPQTGTIIIVAQCWWELTGPSNYDGGQGTQTINDAPIGEYTFMSLGNYDYATDTLTAGGTITFTREAC